MSWQIGTAMNLVIATAYLGIVVAIVRPLVVTGQFRENKLGVATAAIFLTCAVHHGGHAVHMLLPVFGIDVHQGLAVRQAFDWHMSSWDVVTAGAAVYYWTLRSLYGPLMRGAKLFEDMKEKQRQALEINDNIVQGLTVAQMALQLDEKQKSVEALNAALASARQIISDLLGEVGAENRLGPGDLVRSRPATFPR